MNFYSEDNIWAPSRQELSDLNIDGKWIQSPLTAIEDSKRVKITIMTGPAYEPSEDIEDIMRDFRSNGTEVPYDPEYKRSSSIEIKYLHKALAVLDRLEELRKAEILRRSKMALDENNNYVPQRPASSLMNKIPTNGVMRDRGSRCVFCIKNGEEDVHHKLKDEHGKTICPVLRKFKCRLCGAFGDNSHTQKYCPKNPLTKGDPVAAGMPPGLLPSVITFK